MRMSEEHARRQMQQHIETLKSQNFPNWYDPDENDDSECNKILCVILKKVFYPLWKVQ